LGRFEKNGLPFLITVAPDFPLIKRESGKMVFRLDASFARPSLPLVGLEQAISPDSSNRESAESVALLMHCHSDHLVCMRKVIGDLVRLAPD
jgi:hypothetical protein